MEINSKFVQFNPIYSMIADDAEVNNLNLDFRMVGAKHF